MSGIFRAFGLRMREDNGEKERVRERKVVAQLKSWGIKGEQGVNFFLSVIGVGWGGGGDLSTLHVCDARD